MATKSIKAIPSLTTILIVLVVCFCLPFHPPRGYSQSKFVPIELARTAALHHAQEIFGSVYFFDVETYCDLDDNPIVFVFTLYRRPGPLPLADGINNKVRFNRTKRIEIEKEIVGLPNEHVPEQKAEIRKYWKEMRQEEDFVTVIASATYENVPVIQMYAGLPLHIVALEDTKEIASKELNTRNIFIRKLRYIPPLMFEFEFEDNLGKNALVSPLDFKIRDISNLRQSRPIMIEAPRDRQRMIEKKWDSMKNFYRDNR